MREGTGMTGDAYEAALAAMQEVPPNERAALRLLKKAYKDGNPHAAYALATWYLRGCGGLEKKPLKAVELLEMASAKGIPGAMFDLAVCFESGEGVKKDQRRAAMLYMVAALKGDPQSYFEVGRCFYYGIGVKKDRELAELWFDKAGELGEYVEEPGQRDVPEEKRKPPPPAAGG